MSEFIIKMRIHSSFSCPHITTSPIWRVVTIFPIACLVARYFSVTTANPLSYLNIFSFFSFFSSFFHSSITCSPRFVLPPTCMCIQLFIISFPPYTRSSSIQHSKLILVIFPQISQKHGILYSINSSVRVCLSDDRFEVRIFFEKSNCVLDLCLHV